MKGPTDVSINVWSLTLSFIQIQPFVWHNQNIKIFFHPKIWLNAPNGPNTFCGPCPAPGPPNIWKLLDCRMVWGPENCLLVRIPSGPKEFWLQGPRHDWLAKICLLCRDTGWEREDAISKRKTAQTLNIFQKYIFFSNVEVVLTLPRLEIEWTGLSGPIKIICVSIIGKVEQSLR